MITNTKKQKLKIFRQHIKKQRYYLPTKVHLVKAMVFPVVMEESMATHSSILARRIPWTAGYSP